MAKGSNKSETIPAWAAQFQLDMKASVRKVIVEELTKLSNEMKAEISELQRHTKKQQLDLDHIRSTQSELDRRLTHLECRSMRNNLLISGIQEVDDETPHLLKASVTKVFKTVLKLGNKAFTIDRLHRLRPQPVRQDGTSQPRSIIVCLANHTEVGTVLSACKLLKNNKPPIFINAQYPQKVLESRKVLLPIFRRARELKIRASLKEDLLYIDGVRFSSDDLEDIPFDIKDMDSKVTDATFAFGPGRLSPLSNAYQCDMEIEGSNYVCAEQYFQQQKALAANDLAKATKIMVTSNPAEMKSIGDKINTKQIENWQPIPMMKRAIQAKFHLNKYVGDALVKTGDKTIVEASMDKFWGCGKRLNQRDALCPSEWNGRNNLGKLLQDMREELTTEPDSY